MLNNSGGWGMHNKMDTGYMEYNPPIDVEESLNSLLSDPYDFMSSPLSSVPAPLISSTALPPIPTPSSVSSLSTAPLAMDYANNTFGNFRNSNSSFLPPQITINNAPTSSTFSPVPLVPTLPSPPYISTPTPSPVPSPTSASLNSMAIENGTIIPAQASPFYPSSTASRSLTPSKNETKRKRSKKDDASGDEVFKGFDWDNFQPSQLSYTVYDAYSKQPIGDALDMILYKSGTNTHLSASENAWISYRQNQFRIVCLLKMPQNLGQLCIRDGLQEFEIKQFCVKLYAITSTPAGIREEVQVGLCHVGKTRVKKEKTEIVAIPFVDGKAEFTNLQFERSNAVKGQQEYYHLVATLYAKSHTVCYPILSKISPRIIVRGQHPGFYRSNSPVEQDQTQQVSPNTSTNSMMTNSVTTTSTVTNSVMTTSLMTNYANNANFGNNTNYASSDGSSPKTYISESDPVWQSGQGESVYHIGKVGINTSEPTEALTVHGNAIITGNIYTPSDVRIKHDFKSVESSEQLNNIRQLSIYDYKVQDRSHRGVIAQELQAVIPRAVHCAGDVHINGNTVPDLLVVNERSLIYENIGATQHLDKEFEREKVHIIDIDHRVDDLSQSTAKLKFEIKDTIRSIWDMFFAEETYEGDKNGPEWREEQVVFGVNLFRMGPARSFMVLGYFFSYLWLFGALFVFSNVKSRQIIGRACIMKFVLWWVIWAIFFLGGTVPWGMAVYYVIGVNLMLGNWRRNKRRMELRRQGREDELEGSGTNGWTTGWSCWERNFMRTSAPTEKMDEDVAFLHKADEKSF